MTDQPKKRPGAQSVETLDGNPDQPRRPGPDESGILDSYPEQPNGPAGQGPLMQGDRNDYDAVTGRAGARAASPASSNRDD